MDARIADRPQEHGGRLNSGSPKPGGHGIGGRPKAEVRYKLLQKVEKAADLVQEILDGKISVKEESMLRAIEICMRYGLGTQDEKIVLDTAAVPHALAESLALENIPQDQAYRIARNVAERLGLEPV